MRKIYRVLNNFEILLLGAALSSLWITHTDNWKWYMLICLACIVLRQSLSDD